MTLSKLLPMAILGGVAYTQQDTIASIVEAPLEATKIVRCHMEIGGIQRVLVIDTLSGDIPRDLEYRFSDFVRQNLRSSGTRDVSLDPWGNLYRAKVHRTEIEIWSHGPDEIDDTSDDIWATNPY